MNRSLLFVFAKYPVGESNLVRVNFVQALIEECGVCVRKELSHFRWIPGWKRAHDNVYVVKQLSFKAMLFVEKRRPRKANSRPSCEGENVVPYQAAKVVGTRRTLRN